jgi:hypothetical protein
MWQTENNPSCLGGRDEDGLVSAIIFRFSQIIKWGRRVQQYHHTLTLNPQRSSFKCRGKLFEEVASFGLV